MITIDRTSYRSPNHHKRSEKIKALVLHTGGGTKASDLKELTTADASPVSSGYYVDRSGNVYCLVDDSEVAYHAGISSYQGLTNWNEFSIGIETEHSRGQNWPAVQKQALKELCMLLIERYAIPQHLIAAHRWIAPDRKTDPDNWTDATLKPWISGLYLDLDRQAWGNNTPYYATYRIPTAWRKHKAELGQAVAAPRLPNLDKGETKTTQYFELGMVEYDSATDLTVVYVILARYNL